MPGGTIGIEIGDNFSIMMTGTVKQGGRWHDASGAVRGEGLIVIPIRRIAETRKSGTRKRSDRHFSALPLLRASRLNFRAQKKRRFAPGALEVSRRTFARALFLLRGLVEDVAEVHHVGAGAAVQRLVGGRLGGELLRGVVRGLDREPQPALVAVDLDDGAP